MALDQTFLKEKSWLGQNGGDTKPTTNTEFVSTIANQELKSSGLLELGFEMTLSLPLSTNQKTLR